MSEPPEATQAVAKPGDPIEAIVCFDVPEPVVDDLIEQTRGTSLTACKWIVFGREMNRLGGLAAQWEGEVETIPVLLPRDASLDAEAYESALLVLESENVMLANCIWLQGSDRASLPATPQAAYVDREWASGDVLAVLERLAVLRQSPN